MYSIRERLKMQAILMTSPSNVAHEATWHGPTYINLVLPRSPTHIIVGSPLIGDLLPPSLPHPRFHNNKMKI